MIKKVLTTLLLLCIVNIADAQNIDKSVLIDSIANLSFNQQSRWDIMSVSHRLMEENNKLAPINAEAIVFHISHKTTNTQIADVYREFTDEQLKEVIGFMNTEAYKNISSYAITDTLSRLLTCEMESYLTATTPWESQFVPLKDRKYSTLVGNFLLLPHNKSLFNEIIQPLIPRIKEKHGIEDTDKLSEMKKALQAKFPDYYKTILANYVSQSQLQAIIAFYSRPFMTEALKSSVPPMRPVLYGALLNPKAFYKKATKELGNLISVRDTSTIVRNYIHKLPYISIHNTDISDEPIVTQYTLSPNKEYGMIKKGRKETTLPQEDANAELIEEGYFINEELHGKGYTKLNKGTYQQSEEGYFAFGKLYGKGSKKVSFVNNDGWKCEQSINGYFHKGELNGEIEYYEQIENIPNTPSDATYTITRLGLDIVQEIPHKSSEKNNTSSLEIKIKGTVFNDKLNGKAEVILSNGNYYKGNFMNGYFLNGTARITNTDKSVYEGEFMNGRYEGEGKLTRADGSWKKGFFTFGSFFSGTSKDERGEIHEIQPQTLY